ncbi:MAG: hypothetical protein FJ145_02405 [Deltaproteobacteria bacterium]|nr:hypothetical protein [Deltaproteobacteria bacterium]
MERNPKGLGSSLGEMIATAGEVAFAYSDNDKDGHRLARLALIELIRNRAQAIQFDKDLDFPTDTKATVH